MGKSSDTVIRASDIGRRNFITKKTSEEVGPLDTHDDYHLSSTGDSLYHDDEARLPSWCTFVLGGIITYLLVYIGIARPASMELSLVRQQMSTLERSVWEVAGHQGTATEGADLLSVLAAQQDQLAAAKETLVAMRSLNDDIAKEAREISVAHSALAELVDLKELVIANSEDALAAADVVATSEMVCDRLAASASKTQLALAAGDDLLALSDGIISQSEEMSNARQTLEEMIGLNDLIGEHAPELVETKENVQHFVALKDSILIESIDLAEAIETLELTSDLSKQFNEAVQSFGQMRNWMIEIVASESLLDRAQLTFDALTEFSSLQNLAPLQLRAVAKAMTGKGDLHVASRPADLNDSPPSIAEALEDIDAASSN